MSKTVRVVKAANRKTADERKPTTLSREFGKRLAALRKRAALTQTELAAKAGVSQEAICYLESGLRRPSFNLLAALAAALNVPAAGLLPK